MITFEPSPFHPNPLLSNTHAQTALATLLPRTIDEPGWEACGRWREFTLADGDRLLAMEHLHPDDPGRTRPMVVLMHGLEGDMGSHYMRGMSVKAYRLGFHSLRLNYRGCGGTEEMAKQLYNGHRLEDVDHVLRTLAAEAPGPLVPVGVSLGANMLLRLLSTYGEHPPVPLLGAVAISPPIDFHMTLKAFQTGVNRGYDLYFLRKLKAKMARRIQLHADDPVVVANARKGLQAPWLRDYDEAVTAPEGGFESAHDYYTRSGVEDGLALIRVPTLIIHAKDDPLIPLAMFEQRAALIAANPCLKTYFPDHGGHVGFMESPLRAQPEPWRDQFWAENEAMAYVRWLDEHVKVPVGGGAAAG